MTHELVYYHGSNNVYDFPNLKIIELAKEDDDKASKVALGYYVTTMMQIAQQCGTELYEIKLHDGVKAFKLPLSDMLKHNRKTYDLPWVDQINSYLTMRSRYLHDGCGILHIIEDNGTVGESVIIDLDCIQSFVRRAR